MITRKSGWGVLALAVGLASCTGDTPTEPAVPGPLFAPNTGGDVTLCKYGPVGTTAGFTISATGGTLSSGSSLTLNATLSLEVGPECATVWTSKNNDSETVTITELEKLGLHLFRIVVVQNGVATFHEAPPNYVDVTVDATQNVVVFFKNEAREIEMTPGRMTGGGRQITVGDLSVTRGFTIHCDITLSNNLEINWPENNKWHIDKPLTSATCLDNGDPTPPDAPFNTFMGEGTGRLNGVDGSVVHFTFVDNGEPGRNDQASFRVWAPGVAPGSADPVLVVELTNLDHGNIQAHYDQPHGNKPN